MDEKSENSCREVLNTSSDDNRDMENTSIEETPKKTDSEHNLGDHGISPEIVLSEPNNTKTGDEMRSNDGINNTKESIKRDEVAKCITGVKDAKENKCLEAINNTEESITTSDEAVKCTGVEEAKENKCVEGLKNDENYKNDNDISEDNSEKEIPTENSCNSNEKPDTNSNLKNVDNNENPDTNYDPNNVEYVGDVAVYTDPQSGYKYKWDAEKNEWVNFTEPIYSFEGDTHVYTSSDGSKYFWDKERSGWFPKVEEDFMAQYQMNYGFTEPAAVVPKKEPEKKSEPPKVVDKGVKRKPSEPTWFEQDEKQSTKVYVSNLPLDITEEEFVEVMQKCGIIMLDPVTNKLKIKLYSDPESKSLKGDGLCTYIRMESVELALKLLDGYDLRGKKIQVERAKFQMRGSYDPKLKPKSKKRKDKDKLKKMQQKLFDWRPEKQRGERAKHERIVILKNMFDPKVFDDDVGLILEFKNDLNEECSKCGEVRKVTIFDRHPEGVAQVNMSDPEAAEAVVALLNGRWFGKRQLSAEIWDGRTKYRIAETDSQITQRLGNWDKFLEGEEEKKKTEEVKDK